MPEPKEHAESRGWIETMVSYIPGFRGYLRKENRREADELQREWLADRLQRSKRGMDACAQALVEAGRLDEVTQIERLRPKLDKLLARIRGAMQGYSGFFDLVDINESVLDRVYEHDVALVRGADLLADGLEQLRDRPEATADAVRPLVEQIEGLEDAWDEREDLLKGLD